MYNRLFIDSLSFMAVGEIGSTYWGLIGPIYSPWPSFVPSPSGSDRMRAGVSIYIELNSPLQAFLIISYGQNIKEQILYDCI